MWGAIGVTLAYLVAFMHMGQCTPGSVTRWEHSAFEWDILGYNLIGNWNALLNMAFQLNFNQS